MKQEERFQLIKPLWEQYLQFQQELVTWSAGSERAGKRARVASVKLCKKLKKFRQVSLGKE